MPDAPAGMKRQEALPERFYSIVEAPDSHEGGRSLSPGQVKEAKEKLASIFGKEKSTAARES